MPERLTQEEIEEMRNRDPQDNGMRSDCGEYNCPCHYDLPRALDAASEANRLATELDATECSHSDEEAAHADTLRLLGEKDKEIERLKAELEKYITPEQLVAATDEVRKLVSDKLVEVVAENKRLKKENERILSAMRKHPDAAAECLGNEEEIPCVSELARMDLEEEVRRLKGIIGEMLPRLNEWRSQPSFPGWCHACNRSRSEGHSDKCPVADVLRRAREALLSK